MASVTPPKPSTNTNTNKKRKKAAPLDVKKLAPEVKQHPPGKLNQLKAQALRTIRLYPHNGNAHIRVVERDWGGNAQLTAGYFGVHSTGDLRQYAQQDGKSSSPPY
jgi:hypothetical protein